MDFPDCPVLLGLRGRAGLLHGFELGLGGHAAAALAQFVEPHVQVRVLQFGAQAGLRHLALDVVAHRAERLHLGVHRQAIELTLDLEPGLGAVHLRQHAFLLGLELVDLGLHLDQ